MVIVKQSQVILCTHYDHEENASAGIVTIEQEST